MIKFLKLRRLKFFRLSILAIAVLTMGGIFLFKNIQAQSIAKEALPAERIFSENSGKIISPKSEYQKDELLIKLKDQNQSVKDYLKKEPIAKDKIESKTVAPINKESPAPDRIYRVKTTKDAQEIAKELNRQPEVEFAEPNYELAAMAIPNDPQYSQQWALPKIRLPQAWAITKGSANITIAVIDTGVDWDHPDLANNIWLNSDEVADGTDSDGNGYVDDVRGWDFTTATNCYPGDDCDGVTDNNPMDFQGHGTAVSGVASAVTNNSVGIAGAGWQSKIMAVRAGFARAKDGRGTLYVSDAANAIRYAADNGANIINMSWGGIASSTVRSAVNYAFNKGCLMVAAAGNSGSRTKFYPAARDNVLAVGGTTGSDQRWSSSSYGSWVNISAPAKNIRTTAFNDSYTTASGTSLAAPLISGVAALVKAHKPSLDRRAIAKQLITYASQIKSLGIGNRINAQMSLWSPRRHPNGTLIRQQGKASVYLIENGKRKGIPSATIFRNRYYWRDVITVSKSEKNSYQYGGVVGFKEGTLVRAKGRGTVYIVENNRLRGFRNAKTFRKFGYRWKNIIAEKGRILFHCHKKGRPISARENYPDGSLIRRKGQATVYVIKDNKKWSVSSSVFSSWKFRWRDIINLSRSRFNRLAMGGSMPHREGTLIRVGSGRVYYLLGGLRQAFGSGRFKSLGYSWKRIYRVKSREKNRYKYGLLPRI